MRKNLVAIGVCIALLGAWGIEAQDINVLVIVPQYYGANTNFYLDDFERFGWTVTFAGTEAVMQPCPAYGGPRGCLPIAVDVQITDITDLTPYDCLAIMPGSMNVSSPYRDLVIDDEALALVNRAVDEGLVVFASCGGVRVLAAADVLQGVEVTGHSRYQGSYSTAGAIYLGSGIPAVIDGNIVTATRGMYYHEANSEAVAIAVERRRAAGGGR